ncbi:stage V sporulation protein B [Paenibacillus silviterrae]|uniref:stage V sporulation protein B n=1 Tax=Paenibacillus silviterrae TaxID=3242194 RepID=UPI002542B53E|nr:stage V sporulation protein B [Paenibacillus chinjuensis]
MQTKQTFVKGTILLTLSAFITRILGFVNSIVLARFLGPEGIGLLMMAHPLVPMLVTLTSLGLPVAISKLVAEAEVRKDRAKIRKIMTVSLSITGTMSIVLTLLAVLGADHLAGWLLTDSRAYYAMLATLPIAPLVAVSAVLKGYFRGKQNMKPLALSDVIEQIIRVTLIAALVQMLLPYGVEYAAAGAMISSVIGEGAGLLYLIVSIRLHQHQTRSRTAIAREQADGEVRGTAKELLQIGLPTTGEGFIHSIYRAIQPMLITKSMAIAGISTVVATKQYGLLVGYAFPLLMFPSFIMHSLATALVPAISEANALRQRALIHDRIDQAIRIAVMIGAPCSLILYVWAVPLTTMVYHVPEAGPLLQLLAPVFLLQYIEPPLHAVLLGMGQVKAVMRNFILTTVLKAAAIFYLGSQLGIVGVVWGINIGLILITFLNMLSISRCIGFSLDLRSLVKTALCLAAMLLAGQVTLYIARHAGIPLPWSVVSAILASLCTYIYSLIATNTIKRRDMRKIPVLRRMFT